MVLTTGNKSEMAVGYATLYGDMVGGYSVLKDVFKTMVYRLARYRNQLSQVIPERVIDRAPSADCHLTIPSLEAMQAQHKGRFGNNQKYPGDFHRVLSY
ncbi:MAG: hypothetical protein F6K09_30920, partial [Merismopedia sp. SIO2A8]|nr:hypothetical protein [Merismopedia sp. SIO2A8]